MLIAVCCSLVSDGERRRRKSREDNFDEKFPLSENLRMFAFDINFRTALDAGDGTSRMWIISQINQMNVH